MKQRFGSTFNPARFMGPEDWYFSNGFAQELDVTWGQLNKFAIDIYTMKFFRAQTCWLDSSLEGMQDRRQAVLGMARGILNERDLPSGELQRIWPMIGVDTCSRRLADTICQAYITPPVRTFSEDEPTNDGFNQLYDALELNEIMNEAYRKALFVNTVLIWWDGDEFVVLTPDEFRLEQTENGEPEVWICRREGANGMVIRFDVWTKEGVVTNSERGRFMSKEPNRYGRIPGVIMKLGRSLDTYGGGIVEAAEINAWGGLIRLFSTRISLFQSFPITLGINLAGLKEGQRIGPGSVLQVNNPTGEAGSMPDIKSIEQKGQYEALERFRRLAINSFERNEGLPGYLVDEGAGTPPTGAALQVMERTLNDRRKQHIIPLTTAEQDMLGLVQAIVAAEDKFAIRRSLKSDSVTVLFAQPQTFDDPLKSLAYDQQKAKSGVMSPLAYVEKYLGVKCTDDAEATAMMTANAKAFSFLTPVALPAEAPITQPRSN